MGWSRRLLVRGYELWSRGLRGHDEGVAYVEYITLVVTVGILVAAALLAVGMPLLRSYRFAQLIIGAPIP